MIDYKKLEEVMLKVIENVKKFKNFDEDKNEYLKKLDSYLKAVQEQKAEIVKHLYFLFAPTGEFQELFIDNYESDLYIDISNEFDRSIGIQE